MTLNSMIGRIFVLTLATLCHFKNTSSAEHERLFEGTLVSGLTQYRFTAEDKYTRVGGIELFLVHGTVDKDAPDPLQTQLDRDVSELRAEATLGMFSLACRHVLDDVSIVYFTQYEAKETPHFFATAVTPKPKGSRTRLSAKVVVLLEPIGGSITDPLQAARIYRGIIEAFALDSRPERDRIEELKKQLLLLRVATVDLQLEKWYPAALEELRKSESPSFQRFLKLVPRIDEIPFDEEFVTGEVTHAARFRKKAG